MNNIERIAVAEERFAETWGVRVYDYNYLNARVDLQDMLIAITQHRAVSIEDEVKPLEEIITRRNTRLERYGIILQKLTELQSSYTGTSVSNQQVSLNGVLSMDFTSVEFWKMMSEIGVNGSGMTLSLSKAECEGAVARCKNEIDSMNNAAQKDMTRLQSVVDRRDESYSTATTLMTSVSDTRSSLIRNL